jgi:hypothetical protein
VHEEQLLDVILEVRSKAERYDDLCK